MKLYVIPKINELDRWLKLSSEFNLGFEYNEFYNPLILEDEFKVEELVERYKKLNRIGDTLHGVFFDINFVSADPRIKNISIERAKSSLDIATKLNCKAVIFHTNYQTWIKDDAYRDMWVKETAKVYRDLLNLYPDIDIYVENMFDEDPVLLAKLAEELSNEKHFGVCLDIAHAYISNTPLDIWFDLLDPYIKHIHLNDNDKYADLHLALGKGSLDIKYIIQKISRYKDITVLLEMKSYDDIIESMEVLRKVTL